MDKIVLLAKQPGITSFTSLYNVKRAFNTTKVGHTGTLDNFAQGLLVVCTGRLTKLAGNIIEFDKSYKAVLRFGTETDTLDYEGNVVKNQTKLNDPNTRQPFYLKIVNEDFKESMKIREKVLDPQVEAEKAEALRIVQSIVTKNRIEKELYKMRDEGIVPAQLQPSDMKLVAKNLPKRIYDDCVKEEKELVEAAGEHFGKMCGSQTMKLAREIIIGE